MAEEKQYDFPTEEVELPSKGLVYSKENPLSSGKVTMRYMTALHEDILTNQNYIRNGTVIDKLLSSLIVSNVDYNDLVVGDKNAIMIAARVLGYGKNYEFTHEGQLVTIDLTKIENKEFNPEKENVNEFEYVLPTTGIKLVYKLLNNHDDKLIQAEIKGLKKLNKESNASLSTRLKYMILSFNGETEKSKIHKFVDNQFIARDSKAFRKHLRDTQPDVHLMFSHEGINGVEEDVEIPITTTFFWPE